MATYSGNLDFNSSYSANKGLRVSKETSKETSKENTKVALKLSASKVTFGHETFEQVSVNVSPELFRPMPSGKVTVKIPSMTLCVISLFSGKGTCTL